MARQGRWPTPLGTDGDGGRRSSHGRPDGLQAAVDPIRYPTPHGFGADGHGNELSMAVRVVEGQSDSDRSKKRLGGWPTPSGMTESRGSELSQTVRVEEGVVDAERDGDGHWRRTYPSPRVGSGGAAGGSDLRDVVNGERPRNWPTPKASPSGPDFARAGREESGGDDLATATEQIGLWPTPRASEWKGTGPLGSKSQEYRLDRHYLDATVQDAEQESGPLNPDWVEWLMGFPIGWTDLEVDEPEILEGEPWPVDPSPRIPRMRRGVTGRKQRLMQLGNAVVPQIPEALADELRDLLATVEEE